MIRICPERDGRCPHGMDCPFSIDRFSCDMDKNREALKAPGKPMTSESGIEAALLREAIRSDEWPAELHQIVDAVNNASDEHDLSTEQCVALGVLLSRRHPPASREEGLIDALTKVRDAILSPINSSAIVDTVWMPVPGATFSIETLVDFIDAALQSKKPE